MMWKNTIEPDRPRMTIWHTRIVCWLPKVTDILSEYIILTPFLLQQWLYERAPCCVIRLLPLLLMLDWLEFNIAAS